MNLFFEIGLHGQTTRNVMSTTTLRLPNVPPSKSSNKSSNSLISPKATEYTRLSLALLFVALVLGTAYSVFFNTYLDTSNPLIAHLPHPAQDTSYFARKSNVFNRVFVKRAWGWTVGVSVALGLTGRR
jgi:Inositol phospholipid synthesis and fat-storage-inducing TM